jgi:hypothetical protein
MRPDARAASLDYSRVCMRAFHLLCLLMLAAAGGRRTRNLPAIKRLRPSRRREWLPP